MSTFYRQRPGWTFARAVRGDGVYVRDDTGRRLIDAARGATVYASGGQAAGAGDLILLGPPLGITREQVDEAVDILGDAISAATRAAP